jgi:hypothetical protein
MPSIVNRSVMILLILFASLSLANAQAGAAPQSASITSGASSWTWIQDSPVIFCGQLGSISSCTIGAAQIAPTTAGSVWVIDIQTINNVTITSVTGGGGTWIKCPNCHASDNAGNNVDAIYNLTGNAGTTQNITINLSGPSGNAFNVDFVEFMPPAGTTASLDASGSINNGLCTTCSGVNLGALTATDFVMQTPGPAVASWNSVSAPGDNWIVDTNGGAFKLNTTSGAAPTNILPSPGRVALYASLAFKSSAGVFTPPAYLAQNSVVQFFSPSTNPSNNTPFCNPTCTLTLPQATGAGNLLFVMAADLNNDHITSVSGGGNWIVPSGANTCQANWNLVQASGAVLSCAYVLSSTSGATSISVTLNGNSSTGFAFWEISSSSGLPWVLDAQGSRQNGTSNFAPPGPSLSIKGKNDVIFQGAFVPGGASSGGSYYPQSYILHSGSGYLLFNEASEALLLNSGPTAPTPLWVNPQGASQNTGMIGIAFTSAGTSTAPNPPTGLAAVVH